MKKNIVLLTNESTHHHYFVKKINKKFINLYIFLETKKIKASFKTKHNIDKEIINYEKKIWFKDKYQPIKEKFKIFEFYDFNSNGCINKISKIKPDYIISFGSSFLKKKFLLNFKNRIFNFHGGEPSLYRGLDSHFWSIYHGDFNNLFVTFHKIEKALDTGRVILNKKINLKQLKHFKELRALNTEICVQLFNKFLKNKNRLKSFKQKQIGRYYSFMPAALKEIVLKKFNKFIKK